MWTYKLHRTRDGASVTIPKTVLRLWASYRVERVRVELLPHGRLQLSPYTADLRPVLILDDPEEVLDGDQKP
jgi:hypothetical protein